MTAKLPQPNQIDDFYQHVRLGEKAEAAAARGHTLLAKGDERGARKALEEADAYMEKRALLAERWKPVGGVCRKS